MRVKRIGEHGLPVPRRGSVGACGYDLQCALTDPVMLRPGETVRIPTGFAWEIDPAMAVEVLEAVGQLRAKAGIDTPAFPVVEYGLIRDRSSMAAMGVFVVGGVVDGDYRGEIAVLLHNSGNDFFKIVPGQKIAQMIHGVAYAHPVRECSPDEVLGATARGDGGFGSTGA